MKKIYIFILIVTYSLSAKAQFDKFDGVSESEPSKVKKLSSQVKVDSKDIKALSRAKQTKDEELFVKAVSKVLGRDDKNLDALNALAVFYLEKDKPGLAKLVINRALEVHPDEKALYNNIGIVHLSEGDLRSAIRSFKKAIALNRNYRTALANLGSIYLEFGDYRRALDPLQAGYSLIKSNLRKAGNDGIEIANNYAVALEGANKPKEAKRIYERILDSDSRNIGVLANYATLLTKVLKDKTEARKAISRLKFVSDSAKFNKKADQLDQFLEALSE